MSKCSAMQSAPLLFVIVYLLLVPQALGQARCEVQFPDILGYKTLLCDLHTHTVFSDGAIWPSVRVEEAWREGLDAVAITDHVEYKPHKDSVSTELNVSFTIAEPKAKAADILFPRGAEIARDTPPGHFNALFLADITPLNTEDLVDAVRAANEQGAFVFWNHPGWKGPERGNWQEIHQELYENHWLHGIEVVNGGEYYAEAHQWCLEKNLAMLGNSDIHNPSLIQASVPASHRTITLVFAKSRTLDALKEALLAGRTAVWHRDQLIGRQEYLDAIFNASVEVAGSHHSEEDVLWVKVKNSADIDIDLRRIGTLGPSAIKLAADAVSLLKIESESTAGELILHYAAENFLITPGKGLPVQITIPPL